MTQFKENYALGFAGQLAYGFVPEHRYTGTPLNNSVYAGDIVVSTDGETIDLPTAEIDDTNIWGVVIADPLDTEQTSIGFARAVLRKGAIIVEFTGGTPAVGDTVNFNTNGKVVVGSGIAWTKAKYDKIDGNVARIIIE